jgi:hypothetical protein
VVPTQPLRIPSADNAQNHSLHHSSTLAAGAASGGQGTRPHLMHRSCPVPPRPDYYRRFVALLPSGRGKRSRGPDPEHCRWTSSPSPRFSTSSKQGASAVMHQQSKTCAGSCCLPCMRRQVLLGSKGRAPVAEDSSLHRTLTRAAEASLMPFQTSPQSWPLTHLTQPGETSTLHGEP